MCVCRTSENCKSFVLQDMCNIEIFLSPVRFSWFPNKHTCHIVFYSSHYLAAINHTSGGHCIQVGPLVSEEKMLRVSYRGKPATPPGSHVFEGPNLFKILL